MLKKIQLSYFFRYLGDALFYPFMSLYLINRSIEGEKLGIILGVLPLIAIVANLLFSFVKINHKYERLVLYIMLLFEGVMIFLYGFNLTFLLYFILTIFVGLTNTPYYSLLDSYTTRNIVSSNEYPRIRIMGSIAYIFGGAFGGILIDKIGYFYLFLIAFITYIISFIFFLFVKERNDIFVLNDENKTNYKICFNSCFLIYILFYVLILGSNNIFDTYFNVYLEQLGFNVVNIGIINSFIVVSETIMMLVMIKVLQNKINLKSFLLFCALTLVVKNFVFYFDLPNYILIAFSLLRGVGWGGILAVNVVVMEKLVGKSNLTFALLFNAIVVGVFRSVMNYIVGSIYIDIGFNIIFLSIAITQIIGVIILLFSKKMKVKLND